MRFLGSSPIWSKGIDAALVGRPIISVGIALRGPTALEAFGAKVVAAVHVAVAGAPAEDVSYPLRVVHADTRSRTELQVPLFADVLESNAPGIRAFLAEHDPGEEAAVVCGLPVPHAAIGERPCWTTDAPLARVLETKEAGIGSLEGVLPWIPSEAVPDRVDEGWWREVTERLGTGALIVQAVGLNCSGTRTRRCTSLDDVAHALDVVGTSRVSPYVDGVSANVMGCVGAEGAVCVLPPSRQLLTQSDGRPLYCGNVLAGVDSEVRSQIIDETRRAGDTLAARGYVGAFGLDCIIDASGRRHYHEVNARVNGSVHALNLLFPAYVGLLSAPGWLAPGTAQGAQQEAADLVEAHPIARWSLIEEVTEPGLVWVPRSGVYRLDLEHHRASFVEGGYCPDAIGGEDVLVRASCSPDWLARTEEQVEVAELWCSAQLANELERRWEGSAVPRLLELLRTASAD
jgi:hypothetical protein